MHVVSFAKAYISLSLLLWKSMQVSVCLAADPRAPQMFLYIVHNAMWLNSREVFSCPGHLCCKCGKRLLHCVALRGCGLQLEGVSRQKIVPAKISHSQAFHLAPLFPPSPDLGWHLCACLQWTCTHAGLCLCVCVSGHAWCISKWSWLTLVCGQA